MNAGDELWVGLAGSAGALARWRADAVLGKGRAERVPAATMAINVTGSVLLGVLAGLVEFHHVTPTLTMAAGTGFCGGYTTFSTASYETVALSYARRGRAAMAASVGTAAACLVAVAVGLALASL